MGGRCSSARILAGRRCSQFPRARRTGSSDGLVGRRRASGGSRRGAAPPDLRPGEKFVRCPPIFMLVSCLFEFLTPFPSAMVARTTTPLPGLGQRGRDGVHRPPSAHIHVPRAHGLRRDLSPLEAPGQAPEACDDGNVYPCPPPLLPCLPDHPETIFEEFQQWAAGYTYAAPGSSTSIPPLPPAPPQASAGTGGAHPRGAWSLTDTLAPH